jgi:hypothetical protein
MTNEPVQAFGQVRDQIRKRQTEELSKKILSSMNNAFVGDETKAWLADVSENVDPATGAPQDDQVCQLGMVEMMDRLFDDFYRYAYQFNQTEDSRKFVVTCHRPKASSREDASTLYQGSLLNSVQAMIVSGGSKAIRFAFISPEVLAVDQSARPTVFFELDAHAQGDAIRWSADGKPIMMSHVPYLTKKIFARLIRVSRGEVTGNELLMFDAVKEAKGGAADEGATVPEQNNADVITYSLISILDAVDSEVQVLQQDGMDALKQGGMEALAPMMQRVKSLRAFREKAAALAREWSDFISK